MAEPDWREARVASLRDLTPDVRLFELAVAGAGDPAPGSHVKVALSVEGRRVERSYSIVGGTGGVWRIAVKRLAASRGGSAAMWRLAPGDRLAVAGPHNHFPMTPGRPEYLLIAGGIGITPIFAHALALGRAGASFRVAYAARRREDLALAEALAEAIGDRLALFVGAEGARLDFGDAFARLAPEAEAYVCGPLRMMEDARRAWLAAGRPAERLRFETFGAGGALPTTPFRVRVPRRGVDIVVPESTSLLEALEAAGVETLSDCRKGECGLCALPIVAVDGVVDHRDVFFSDEEKAANARLCACVSRVCGGSITLDTADR